MTILRRLFFTLFLIGLALPSMAVPAQAEAATPSCHGTMPADAPHHQPDPDDGKTTGHVCVGCAASIAASIISAPMPMPALVPPVRPMTAPEGANAPPSIPPPRP